MITLNTRVDVLRLLLSLAALLVVGTAPALAVDGVPGAGKATVGTFGVTWASGPFRLGVTASDGRRLLPDSPVMGLLTVGRHSPKVSQQFGIYQFKGTPTQLRKAWNVTSLRTVEGALEFTVSLDGEDQPDVVVRVSSPEEGTIAVAVSAPPSAGNWMRLEFPSAPDEAFLGLGEQYNRVRHEGFRVPMWVQEQGIGRTDGWVRLPFNGRTTDSLFPVPLALSSRGHGLLLEGFARSEFGLRCKEHPDRVRLDVHDRTTTLRLVDGPRPADVIRRLTRFSGRPRVLPDWAFGTWLGVQGGPARVRQMLDRVKAAGAPVDAVWVQDWIGGAPTILGYDLDYQWSWNPATYPALPSFVRNLRTEGVRFLGYFNSFIEPRFPEFAHGASRDLLIKDGSGKPYQMRISTMKAGMVDLASPSARDWLGGYLKRAMALGLDGWMADFGEWLPYDARLHGEAPAPLWHNRYPVEWARLNREAALSARPDGDFVIFGRAGFLGSAPWTDFVWAGDQNTSWGDDDGLPTVIPAGLNLGLSGFPFYHFDAGGYTSLITRPRTAELFMRWVEAAALSPLLRTHEGYFRQKNVQPDSTPEILAHFVAMARLHGRLKPFLLAAAAEARASGLPLMRHMWLAFPDDGATLSIHDQYLLGDRLLCAPVLVRGARSRRLYVPRGSWVHWKSGKTYTGPAWVEVEAPMGEPPLLIAAGAALPPAP